MLAAAARPAPAPGAHCPALVLNADHRPLSYYPLSLWSWQDTIKAVFLERVVIRKNMTGWCGRPASR